MLILEQPILKENSILKTFLIRQQISNQNKIEKVN